MKPTKLPACSVYEQTKVTKLFFYLGFLSEALAIHRIVGEGTILDPLYHFHSLTNIQTFICSLFIRDDYLVIFKACHIITRLSLHEIYISSGIRIWLNVNYIFPDYFVLDLEAYFRN